MHVQVELQRAQALKEAEDQQIPAERNESSQPPEPAPFACIVQASVLLLVLSTGANGVLVIVFMNFMASVFF